MLSQLAVVSNPASVFADWCFTPEQCMTFKSILKRLERHCANMPVRLKTFSVHFWALQSMGFNKQLYSKKGISKRRTSTWLPNYDLLRRNSTMLTSRDGADQCHSGLTHLLFLILR